MRIHAASGCLALGMSFIRKCAAALALALLRCHGTYLLRARPHAHMNRPRKKARSETGGPSEISLSRSSGKPGVPKSGGGGGSSGGGGRRNDNTDGSLRFRSRDGRLCKLCNRADSEKDDVISAELIMWAYPPSEDGKPTGMLCYFCLRVYNARYSVKYRTSDALATDMGRSEQLMKEFKAWRALLVEKMVAAGKRDCRIQWPDAALLAGPHIDPTPFHHCLG